MTLIEENNLPAAKALLKGVSGVEGDERPVWVGNIYYVFTMSNRSWRCTTSETYTEKALARWGEATRRDQREAGAERRVA